jgi:NitT/TauT family transport system substrate-binding protein
MSTKLTVLAAALVVLGLAACGGEAPEPAGGGGGEAPTPEGPPPQIKIGHVGHDHHIALFVAALAPDTFAERCGVKLVMKKEREVYDLVQDGKALAELHLSKVGGGSRMPAAMERGDIQVGLGGIPAVVFFVDKGADFKIISPLNVDGDMLLLRPDFPADDWASFIETVKASGKPVKIGYKAPVAVAKLVLMGALDHEGVPHGEAGQAGGVELVNLRGGGKIVPSLESGMVDGAVINEPFGSMAVHKGVGKIVSLLADLPPDGKWRTHPCCCICATAETIANHRAALKALLTLTHDATEFILEKPEEAAKLASEWTKVDLAIEKMSVPNIAYLAEAGDAYRNGLRTWFGMMKDVGQFEGRIKDMSFEDAFELTHDLSILTEVIEGN